MTDILGTLDVDAQVTSDEQDLIKEMIKEKEDLTAHTQLELKRLKAFIGVDLRDANYLSLKDHVSAMEAYISAPDQQRANSDEVNASLQAYKDAYGTWYTQIDNRVYAYPIALLQAILKIRYPDIDLGVTGPGGMGIDGQLGLKTLFEMWERLKAEGQEFGGVVDESLLAHLTQTEVVEKKQWSLENGLLVVGDGKKELENVFPVGKYAVTSAEGIDMPVHLTTVAGQQIVLDTAVEAYVVTNTETDGLNRFVKHGGAWYMEEHNTDDDPNTPDEFIPYDLTTKKLIEIQEAWWDDEGAETVIVETAEGKSTLEKAYPNTVVSRDANLTRPITIQTWESTSAPLPAGPVEAYKVEGTPPGDVLVYLIRYNGVWYKHDNTKDGTVYVPHTLPTTTTDVSPQFVLPADVTPDVLDDAVVTEKVVSWVGKQTLAKDFPNWNVKLDTDFEEANKVELRPASWSAVVLENNIEAYVVQKSGDPMYLIYYNNTRYMYSKEETGTEKNANFVYIPCQLKDVLIENK